MTCALAAALPEPPRPRWSTILADPAIPPAVKALLALLGKYGHGGAPVVYPGDERLAAELGRSVGHVRRLIARAEGSGLIRRFREPGRTRRLIRLVWRCDPPEENARPPRAGAQDSERRRATGRAPARAECTQGKGTQGNAGDGVAAKTPPPPAPAAEPEPEGRPLAPGEALALVARWTGRAPDAVRAEPPAAPPPPAPPARPFTAPPSRPRSKEELLAQVATLKAQRLAREAREAAADRPPAGPATPPPVTLPAPAPPVTPAAPRAFTPPPPRGVAAVASVFGSVVARFVGGRKTDRPPGSSLRG